MLTRLATALILSLSTLVPLQANAYCFNRSFLPNGDRLPVIASNTPTYAFRANADGTVTDTRTQLVWKVCAEGMLWNKDTNTCTGVANGMSWLEALAHVKALNEAGGFAESSHWRLPNVKELMSIMDKQCLNPNINQEVFPNTAQGFYWSASHSIKVPDKAWAISFITIPDSATRDSTRQLKSNPLYVRLVRDD